MIKHLLNNNNNEMIYIKNKNFKKKLNKFDNIKIY